MYSNTCHINDILHIRPHIYIIFVTLLVFYLLVWFWCLLSEKISTQITNTIGVILKEGYAFGHLHSFNLCSDTDTWRSYGSSPSSPN